MKKLRLIMAMVLLSVTSNILSQTEFKKNIEAYKSNVYEVKDYGSLYFVTNKKHPWPQGDITYAKLLEREDMWTYFKRVRKENYDKVDSVAYSVFTPEQVAVIKGNGNIGVSPFWYTKTGDYAGAYFSFNFKLKDIVTIAKVYEMEQALFKTAINAGKRMDFEDPTKKYFW